ncbi:ATP-binding protein [Sporichthya sp.]|uniref:sensor histidine kinase n=1 Tax=Sporichthya sp. TaxID=65475 RepID=UPI0017D59723|nr:ATP-binding protein [Sporichthya sp.]MBA3741334.1 PAS domain-containing protein [Sporichthya sp.]
MNSLAATSTAHVAATGVAVDPDLAAILDSSTDATFHLDSAGVVTWRNRAARRMLGRIDGDLVGAPFVDALHPPDAVRFAKVLVQAGAGARIDDDLQLQLRRTDDQVVPVVLTLAPTSAPGEGGGWWVVAFDLTERRESQRTLAESERRVRRSEALAGTGTFVVDFGASMVQWSEGMYAIFGVDPAEFFPSFSAHLDLIHPDDQDLVRAALAEVLAGRTPAELDHRARHPDGSTVWVFLAIEPTRDPDGRVIGASGVCQDVSVRTRAEATAREALDRERAASEELRRLDRAKEEFLATVSHELRTPLTAILGFSSLLRATPTEHALLLEPIERNAYDMHQMVERLLDYSRLEAGRVMIEPRSVGLAEQVRSVQGQLDSALAGRTVEVDVPDDLVVWADPDALQRILVNLIGNAAKYSEPPGIIRVCAGPGEQGTVVSVADDGPGIAAEHQSEIFERFFRVPGSTRAKRGTGVGLAIVRQYVELHGGRVWVDSEPGQGSTFRFGVANGDGR